MAWWVRSVGSSTGLPAQGRGHDAKRRRLSALLFWGPGQGAPDGEDEGRGHAAGGRVEGGGELREHQVGQVEEDDDDRHEEEGVDVHEGVGHLDEAGDDLPLERGAGARREMRRETTGRALGSALWRVCVCVWHRGEEERARAPEAAGARLRDRHELGELERLEAPLEPAEVTKLRRHLPQRAGAVLPSGIDPREGHRDGTGSGLAGPSRLGRHGRRPGPSGSLVVLSLLWSENVTPCVSRRLLRFEPGKHARDRFRFNIKRSSVDYRRDHEFVGRQVETEGGLYREEFRSFSQGERR